MPTDSSTSSTESPASPGRGRPRPAGSWLLALLGGALWALSHQAEPMLWASFLAWVPFFLLLDRPRPFFFTWLSGFVGWLGTLPWVASTVSVHGGLPNWVGALLLTLLAAALALEHGLVAWITRKLTAAASLHRLWLVPALWVLMETQRGFFVGGFPWNLNAYAWTELPGALEATAWIGAAGLSFFVVLVGGLLALGRQLRRPLVPALGLPAVALLLILAGRTAPSLDQGTGLSFPVRVVQPNGVLTYDRQILLQSYDRLMELSRRACDTPSLLIWPESAAWPYAWHDAPRLRRDVEALGRRGCGVLLSSPTRRSRDLFNSALLIYPPTSGQSVPRDDVAEYAKRRLVPWGEYVPAREWFPFIDGMARNVGDFTPGRDVALLPWRDRRIGMAICYEVIFAGLVAEQVRAGADVLATITNDAWYGDSAAPWQHLRAARFRAAETRRPMLRAALTGVSAMIDARGRVQSQLGVGEQGVLEARVHGSQGLTPYSRAPFAPALLAAAAVAFAMIRRLRRQRPGA